MNQQEYNKLHLDTTYKELIKALEHIHKAREYYALGGASDEDVNWFTIKLVNTINLVLEVVLHKLLK